MVVLTLIAQKNGETIFFEDEIQEASYARLLSCSFYNSWHNLPTVGRFFVEKGDVIASLPPGHYNADNLEKELKDSFELNTKNVKLEIEKNTPDSLLKITNTSTKKNLNNNGLLQPSVKKQNNLQQKNPPEISVDSSLSNLLGIGTKLKDQENVKKLNTPSCYFIFCDLIDHTKNFFNAKRSKLLAKFDVRGKPYEKVSYFLDSSQNVFRETSTDKSFNSITLTVKDENGGLFDFNGLPLFFELEIN